MEKLGKLRSDKNSTFGKGEAIIVSEKNGIILVFNPASFDSDEQMHDTAKLMASAPELLEQRDELLKALNSFVEYCYGTELQYTERFKKGVEVIEKVLKQKQ